MPATHPKYEDRRKANDDGSLRLVVYSSKSDKPEPSVKFKIADPAGDVIIQDLAHACVFTENEDTCRHTVIRLDAGILPIGLMTFHVALNFPEGETTYTDYTVEVPASPFHVESVLDS